MTTINPHRPRVSIPVSELQGKEIPTGENKVVSTKSHDISLESEFGGRKMPDFQLKRRNIEDPGAKAKIIDVSTDLHAITTGAEFKSLLTELLTTNKSFLTPNKNQLLETLPEGTRSNFAYNNIVGQRTEQFFDEAMKLVNKTGLQGAEAKSARMEINHAHRDAYRGRSINYDQADTGSYWSYGHDAPFAHVFEKMLKSMPENDPRREFIQNQLDFIFTHKYVDTGRVNENSIEQSLGLVAIDRNNRDMVSMVEGTEKGLLSQVKYETIKVPASGGEHANKAVYRDGDNHYFQGTRTKVPEELISTLKRTPARTIVFRRVDGEAKRSGMRFDWNGNRRADTTNAGWWGHCDIKATLETLLADMSGSRGVAEFNSTTGETVEYSRKDQLEALAALLNFDDAYNVNNRGPYRLGETEFAGGRFDNRASKMTLKTSRGNLDFGVRLQAISKSGDSSTNVPLDKAFAVKVTDDRMESFTDNPDILRVDSREKDTNYIDASKRMIKGTSDGYTFDRSGNPVEEKKSFTLDLSVDSGEKVLIASQIQSIGSRSLNRYYYDPASKEVSQVATKFVEEDGSYAAKEGEPRSMGRINGIEIGREMTSGDDVAAKLQLLEEAVRTGDKMACDSSLREEVWNGEIHRIQMDTEWRSDDGLWERVGIHVDATFGSGKVGSVLHKLDDEGTIVESFEPKAVVDFFWKDRPRVAPLVSERGNWFVNSAMEERGVISLDNETDKWTSLSAMKDLNDLIFLGLKATGNQKFYTIVHEGKRLMYDDKSAWEADMERLKGTTPPPPPPPNPTDRVKVDSSPNMSIPDNDRAGATDKISVTSSGALEDIKLDIDLKHTYVGDLTMTLIAPDGTEVALHKKSGGGDDDIKGTYGADLNPAESFDKLKGKEIKGDWQLKIVDSAGQDVGNLVSWGLDIGTQGGTPPPPPPPNPLEPVNVSRTANMEVPDNNPAGATDTLAVVSSGKVKDIKIDVDLKHTYIGDVTMSLVAPDGTEVKLHDRGGRSADDISGTFGAGLDAAEDLEKFHGLAAGGDWKLKIVDNANRDVGKLVSWGLNIDVE